MTYGIHGTTVDDPPATDFEQTITVDATSGSVVYGLFSGTSDAVAYNANAATLQTALNALALEAFPELSGNLFAVSGGPGGSGGTTPYVVTSDNRLNLKVVSDTLAGGGASVTVEVTGGQRQSTTNQTIEAWNVDPGEGDAKGGALIPSEYNPHGSVNPNYSQSF